MSEKYPHLFSPGKLASVKIPNRIVFLPHYISLGEVFADDHVKYFVERAKGGTGLIIVGSHAVNELGKMSHNYENTTDERNRPGYEKCVKEVHKQGAKIFLQLTHAGNTTIIHPPQLLISPSQLSDPCYYYNTKEMEVEDIDEVIEAFAQSARVCIESGFDGIEIKGSSHDGLLRNFIDPYFNRRTDKYGGSFENRMRFPLEVVHAIREVIGEGYPFGIRMSVDTYTSFGYGMEEGTKIATAFAESGEIDYFDTDAGCFSAFYMEIPPMAIPLGFAEYLSAGLKHATDLPVIAFGRINDPAQAERMIVDGNADFIGMARELLCDPEFANKAREGRDDDIRHCIACQDGCLLQIMNEHPIHCIQNPGGGREAKYGTGTLKPVAKRKKVAVIGGGPAGLKAAEIAARRGHAVTLYEEQEELGGQVNIAARIPLREEIKDVVRWLSIQAEKLGVKVRLSERMTAQMAAGLDADTVIVATGSRPARGEDTPGADQKNVATVWDVLLGKAEVGEHVLVYDVTRRWPGLGTAEFLVNQGKKVEIVTPFFKVGEQLEPGNVTLALQRILDKDARMTTNMGLKRIEGRTVILASTLTQKEQAIDDVDTVVLSVGNRSNRELYDELKAQKGKGFSKELFFIGDAVAPRLIQQAILEAELLAREL